MKNLNGLLILVSPSLQVNTESVIAGELMTGAGGQREHFDVGSCIITLQVQVLKVEFPQNSKHYQTEVKETCRNPAILC